MANSIQADGAKIQRVRESAQPAQLAAHAVVANDPRPEVDHVALAIGHDGKPVKTATRARGVPDVEVRLRAALREFLRDGTDPSTAEKAFKAAGGTASDAARITSEEASSFFRMSRDEFYSITGDHNRLTDAFGPRPTPMQQARVNDLKTRAKTAFDGAVRADSALGGLDPARGQDLEQMEAELLRMGFPKDEIQISSRGPKAE